MKALSFSSAIIVPLLIFSIAFMAPFAALADTLPVNQPDGINPDGPGTVGSTPDPSAGAGGPSSLCNVIGKGLSNLGKNVKNGLPNIGGITIPGFGGVSDFLKGVGKIIPNIPGVGGIIDSLGDFLGGFGGLFSFASGILNGPKEIPTSDAQVRATQQKIVQKNVGTGGTKLTPSCAESSLDHIAIIAARALLRKITADTIDWINNGFQGKPAYATNLGGYLSTLGDNVAGQYIQAIGAGYLCSPFRLTIQNSLIANYNANKMENFGQQQCTLSQVTGNVNAFLNGDFGQGGWDGWFAMLAPQNHPTGAYMQAKEELSIKLSNQQAYAVAQLNWNRGFLSVQECLKYDKVKQPDGTNPDGSIKYKEVNGACIEQGDVKTPGAVIEANLEKVLGQEVEQLDLVNDFNGIVTALYGYLGRRVFSSVQGLFSGGSEKDTLINYFSGDSSGGVTNGGQCQVSTSKAVVGSTVAWTVNGFSNQGTLFSWSGTDLAASTTAIGTISVPYFTTGEKSMTVSTSYIEPDYSQTPTCTPSSDPSTPPNCVYPTKQGSQPISCPITVTIVPPPVIVQCTLTTTNASVYPSASNLDSIYSRFRTNTLTASDNDYLIAWKITVMGGSGKLSYINIDKGGSNVNVRPVSGDKSREVGSGSGDVISISAADPLSTLSGNPPQSVVYVPAWAPGTITSTDPNGRPTVNKDASIKVSVQDADLNVDGASAQCPTVHIR